jgi:hypothetical protein
MPEDAPSRRAISSKRSSSIRTTRLAHAALALCHETRFRSAGFDETDRTRACGMHDWRSRSGTDDATALAYAAIDVLHLARDFERRRAPSPARCR